MSCIQHATSKERRAQVGEWEVRVVGIGVSSCLQLFLGVLPERKVHRCTCGAFRLFILDVGHVFGGLQALLRPNIIEVDVQFSPFGR